MTNIKKFSKRLNALADLVNKNYDLADIGSDHGFLITILVNKGFKNKLLAVENKKGPFEGLKENLDSLHKDNIFYSLSNGLEEAPENYKTYVIAGMGFSTIQSIINNDIEKVKKAKYLIIDCHTNQTEVRQFITKIGYRIINEKVIYEDKIYYDLICFENTNEHVEYSDVELKYGPINIRNLEPDFIGYLDSQLLQKTKILEYKKNEKDIEILRKEIEEILKIKDGK